MKEPASGLPGGKGGVARLAALLCLAAAARAEEVGPAPPGERARQAAERLQRAGVTNAGVEVDAEGVCVLDLTSSAIADLAPLKGLPVDYICLRWSRAVRDLSPLEGMALTGLDLRDTAVTDLTALASMPLRTLIIAGTGVRDLSPLQGMPLTRLDACGAPVADLSPLRGSRIEGLLLNDTAVSDLEPLRGMPLIQLHINRTAVTNLLPLQGMPLQNLFFQPERAAAGLDLVRGMASMRALGGGKVSDHFVGVAEFWDRFEHGDPVELWLAEVRSGKGSYETEQPPAAASESRRARLQELLGQLGDARFAARSQAASLLEAEGRPALPYLRQHAASPDPEIRVSVGEIMSRIASDPARVPGFAFEFPKRLPMTADQWRQAMEPWRAACETGAAHAPDRSSRSGVGPFAQSFIQTGAVVCAVELMVHAQRDSRGWLKVGLFEDSSGAPAPTAMAWSWVKLDTEGLPPSSAYLPVDLPDTEVVPGATYWIVGCPVPDSGPPTTGQILYGCSSEDRYPDGRLLMPEGSIVPRWDACFRVITKCPPVPLLRKLPAAEADRLPRLTGLPIRWRLPEP